MSRNGETECSNENELLCMVSGRVRISEFRMVIRILKRVSQTLSKNERASLTHMYVTVCVVGPCLCLYVCTCAYQGYTRDKVSP